jgi:SAM-dependent methyltransferase
MDDREFELLEQIDDSHWWFLGKRALLHALVPAGAAGRRVLDLGCGTGGVLRDAPMGGACFGIDRSARALSVCRRRGHALLARADLAAVPFGAATFDTVLALDVIEHLDDDVALLASCRELVGRAGRVIVAVPAFGLLWSQHDETYHHRRRYTARQLERVVRAAGLRCERLTYTNFFVFPVAAVWRLLSYRLGLGRFAPGNDFWPVPAWLNSLLSAVYRAEAWLLRRGLDLPFGVSVVCIARPADEAPDAR